MGNHATHNLQGSVLSVPLILIFLSIPYCPINSITKEKKKKQRKKRTQLSGDDFSNRLGILLGVAALTFRWLQTSNFLKSSTHVSVKDLICSFLRRGLQLSQTSLWDLWCIKVKNRLKKKIQLAYWKPAKYWALLYFIIKKIHKCYGAIKNIYNNPMMT